MLMVKLKVEYNAAQQRVTEQERKVLYKKMLTYQDEIVTLTRNINFEHDVK